MIKINVLIACEESQRNCIAFRERGHNAFSCDVQPCSGGHPEWHIHGDVMEYINPKKKKGKKIISFKTADGQEHCIEGTWDLIIAHPPCTFLTNAGAVRLLNKDGTIKDQLRYRKGVEAAEFFMRIYNADCPRVVVENPVPLKIFNLPKYSQIVEPYFFSDPWKKRTCLWERGVPLLEPTDIVEPQGLWVGSTSANRDPNIYTKYKLASHRDSKTRSKTFVGMANAMAEQWGALAQ